MPRRMKLTDSRLRRARMASQLLDRHPRRESVDVVRHLLGIQAQVLPAAGLALAARTEGLTDESVRSARESDRSIILTWAMRGTLHLLPAEDYGWVRPLVLEPRIANSRRRLRELGLTGNQPDRAVRGIERMLEREGSLTRLEILERLRRLGFKTADEAVAYHLVWLTAAMGGVCHGPMRGADRCFVLTRDWIGKPPAMDRGEALAELALRYLTAHGPATPEDLAFWSGLRMGDARAAWRAVGDRIEEVEALGSTLWTLRSSREEASSGIVRLLPSFDEYMLGWKDRAFAVAPERWKSINRGGGWLHPVLLVEGLTAGIWKAERTAKSLHVEVRPFGSLSSSVLRKIAAESDRLAGFLGARARTSFTGSGEATTALPPRASREMARGRTPDR